MKKNKLVVISYDALIQEDLKHLKNYPNFRYLLENGSLVEDYRSVYPTLTYVCHTTMATGCYPEKHGIINNQAFDAANPTFAGDETWQFLHKGVKVSDIFEAAKKEGLTTAAVGWPVTGGHPFIDWEVAEIWPVGKDRGTTDATIWKNAYLASGTSKTLFEEAVAPVLWMRRTRRQPDSSHFLIRVAGEIIRRHNPDLLMIHEGHIDGYRHKSGVYSNLVKEGLADSDAMLGAIIMALKDAGVFDETNIIITSDHGQLSTVRRVYLNKLLQDKGYIRTDENDAVKDWKAFVFPAGMSAQVYLKNPEDKALVKEVYELLSDLSASGLWGIERVYTREEARMEHLDGEFSFILESDGYTEFCNGINKGYCVSFPIGNGMPDHGSHGFHPSKGPTPVFAGAGPGIKKGVVVPTAKLVDAAPTFARLLNIGLPEADGKAIEDIIL